ncbi:bifunctional hydroxymethylpyrimidine kinase/phosphomethylpyrimidine kinase [Roseobacteraceae bacterium NS-SX3]
MSWILVIAGTDSSGGAGLTRDTAMAAALGWTVKPVVTAVTVQTGAALHEMHPLPPAAVAAQIRAACAGGPPGAVKAGMVGSPASAAAAAGALPPGVPLVLDPVLKASSGGALMDAAALAPLLPHTTLLTPNLAESAVLSGTAQSEDISDLEKQARRLRSAGAQAVLIKGGHGSGGAATDHLFDGGPPHQFSAPRLPRGKRGTGCSLATAIACHLAQGLPLFEACRAGKSSLHAWLAA